MKKLINIDIAGAIYLIIILALIALAFASCADKKSRTSLVNTYQERGYKPANHLAKAKVLENNIVLGLNLTYSEWLVVRSGDSVWVDVEYGRINNKDTNTMLCVVDSVLY